MRRRNVEMMRFMTPVIMFGLMAITVAGVKAAGPPDPAPRARNTTSFDSGWRFLKDSVPDGEQPGLDDSGWQAVDVPHDWSIEGPFDPKNPTGGAGAFLPAGIGWYRKHFTLPEGDARRRVFIDFDGVMAKSDVWINGHHLGNRPNGYVSFRYELTGHLKFGDNQPNVLAVRADNAAQPASRWYAGAGIYRHVRLVVSDPVHIDQWGTVLTTPQVSARRAVVRIRNTVVNQSGAPREVSVQVTLFGPDGQAVGTAETRPRTVSAGALLDFEQEVPVEEPRLWSPDHPALYRALTQVRAGETLLDDEVTSFGIREFHFDAATGFWINGQNLKLKGVCLHHDAGGLGAAVPARAWERRLALLKAAGCNAIRTSHNPYDPVFLDLCDRMGFLVMDEMFDCWTIGKNPYDYHLFFREWSEIDTRDTVRRDRNHPSIVLYSAGNEIRDTHNPPLAKQILTSLIATFHQYDPTRPVTQGLFRPNSTHDYENGLADLLDVIGQNYREPELLAAHRAKPERKIVGTETSHDRTAWLAMRDNPPYSGQFLWTGVDYLGEARHWPTVAAGSGLFDRTGTPRPRGFQRQSWWSDVPMVRIARRIAAERITPSDPGYEPLNRPPDLFCDWTPRDSHPHEENIEVYSNAEEVELLLNGESFGTQPRPASDAPRTWRIPFKPGTLRAIARDRGREVASDTLRTAGKPAKVHLEAERSELTPDWDDVVYVNASVVDEDDVLIPDADDLITFQLEGPGRIAAVDNGDLASHEPFQASERHAFQGRCVAILKATAPSGRITLTASAPGLRSSSVTLQATAPPAPR